MAAKCKIFLSWSKNKSREMAEATKDFFNDSFGSSIEFFFSPEMYKGTRVDNEIHKNLLTCNKCLVCLTADNFKNPWLMYESGVVYGANRNRQSSTVIPILFEDVPDWSSWIDKPLNRYYPISMQRNGKADFKSFFEQLSKEYKIGYKNFDDNWKKYIRKIKAIIKKEQDIPDECKLLYYTMIKGDNADFTISSPDIRKNKIYFHKGFTTNALTKILTNSLEEQGKYLWIYGRKNKKIMSREFEPFFAFLANEGIEKGVDFRCLFPHPKSNAIKKASSRDRKDTFEFELKDSLQRAVNFKKMYGLQIENFFRLYKEPRKKAIIRSDNVILRRNIICDSKGYPLPYTNSDFEMLSAFNGEGKKDVETFNSIWLKSEPLSEELFNKIYKTP